MFVQFGRSCHRSSWQALLLLVVLIVAFYWLQSSNQPPKWLSESVDVDTKIKRFLSTWCRVRDLRTNGEAITRSCKDRMRWENDGTLQKEKTSTLMSQVVAWDIRPAGEFSRLWIRSRLESGIGRQRGGDSWRVRLSGPSSPVVSVFDHGNGSYEAVFLPIEHGKYKAQCILEHTDCDGLKEPPTNWFIEGNSQGRGQKDGMFGIEKSYIGKPMGEAGYYFTFEVPRQLSVNYVREMARILFGPGNICSESCNLLWDGYGRWINRTWEPYRVGEDFSSADYRWTRKRDGVLWFYGDSVMEQFYNNEVKTGNLCQGYQFKCGHTYNWIYRIENNNRTAARVNTDDLDFNVTKVIEQFENVINANVFTRPESTLVLNFGLHFVSATNSTSFINVIDGIIDVINKRRRTGQLKGDVIWRTTTAMNKNKLKIQHKEEKRFFTYQRTRAFNAYATSRICRSGIYVLDVFPLTDSYPFGSGWSEKPNDAVHYEHSVFRSVETLLYHHLRRTETVV